MEGAVKGKLFGVAKLGLYFLGKVAAIAVSLWFLYTVFFTALNTMNVMVIAKEAFTKRASVVLKPIENADKALLDKIFTNEYLAKSGLKTQTKNSGYDIANYIQRTDTSLTIVWPWMDKVTVTVTDVIDEVRATIISTAAEDEVVDRFIDSGTYDVYLIKRDDGWVVNDISMKERIIPKNQLPIPTADRVADTNEESIFDLLEDEPAEESTIKDEETEYDDENLYDDE